jgi:hypothetical protein
VKTKIRKINLIDFNTVDVILLLMPFERGEKSLYYDK